MYIKELSDDTKFFTEAEANRTQLNTVKIKPSKNQTSGVEKAVQFLDKIAIKPYPLSYEVVYDSERRLTEFQITHPETVTSDFRSSLHQKYPNARLEQKNIPEPIFSRAESDGKYVGTVSFTMEKDIWYPINEQYDVDPLAEIINEITNNGDSNVDMMFQVRFQPVQTEFARRVSLREGFKQVFSANGMQSVAENVVYGLALGVKHSLGYYTVDDKVESSPEEDARRIRDKYHTNAKHYVVNVSLVGLGTNKQAVERSLQRVQKRVEAETKDPVTGQKLTGTPSREPSDIVSTVNQVITRQLNTEPPRTAAVKNKITTPILLQHTTLAELVHIADKDFQDTTVDTSNIEDKGEMPVDTPSFDQQ